MKAGESLAQGFSLFGVDVRADDGVAGVGGAGENFAPGPDNHGVSVRAASAGVGSALGGGDDMSQVFNSAGAEQELPVGGAGFAGECGGGENHIGIFHRAIEFGKSKVVADRESEFSEGCFRRDDVLFAGKSGGDAAGFVVLSARPGELKEVDFVVSGDLFAVGAEKNAGGVDAVFFLGGFGADGDGSAENEHFVLFGRLGQEILRGALSGFFGDGEFGGLIGGEEGEKFGEGGDLRAQLRRLGQEILRAGEVVGEVVAGLHLNAGGAERMHSRILPLCKRGKEIFPKAEKIWRRRGKFGRICELVFPFHPPPPTPTHPRREETPMNIRKIATAWLSAAVMAFSVAVPVQSAAAQDDKWAKIRIGVEGEYPPFSAVNEEGELIGFDIDIARALCMEMKAECELIQQDWDGIIPALQAKKFDAIIASMTVNEERKEQVAFTNRYYKDGARFVLRKGDKIKVSYNGLEGKVVGVQRATSTDTFLTAQFPGVEVRRYDTLTNAHLDLQQGRVDLVLGDQFVQKDFADKNDDVKLTGPTYTNAKYFGDISIAVRKEDEDLREKFNAAILAIRENEVYQAINDKYFKYDIYGR